jgi:hypothetical protein
MSLPTSVGFFFDDVSDYSTTDSIDNGWMLSTGGQVKSCGESTTILTEIKPRASTSAMILMEKPIDDAAARKKVWLYLFKDEPMPEPKNGGVAESYGILDSCFAGKRFTAEEVLDLLKKAK